MMIELYNLKYRIIKNGEPSKEKWAFFEDKRDANLFKTAIETAGGSAVISKKKWVKIKEEQE